MIEGGDVPEAAQVDQLCEMFTCLPSQVLDEDEDFLWRVVRARVARNAAWAFDTKGIDPSDGQRDTYKKLLDSLDARDKRRGIPEEL